MIVVQADSWNQEKEKCESRTEDDFWEERCFTWTEENLRDEEGEEEEMQLCVR